MRPALEGAIIRRALKPHSCEGDGSSARRHAPGCPGTIPAGAEHVEYVGETPAYQSGRRVAEPCALAFGYAEAEL